MSVPPTISVLEALMFPEKMCPGSIDGIHTANAMEGVDGQMIWCKLCTATAENIMLLSRTKGELKNGQQE